MQVVFGLGEQKAGKAKGKKHVIVVTLGTGYGLAYILNWSNTSRSHRNCN